MTPATVLAAAAFVALVSTLVGYASICHCRDRERAARMGRRHRWPGEVAALLAAELRHSSAGMAAVVAAAYEPIVLEVVTWRWTPPRRDASGADLVVVLRVPLLTRRREIERIRRRTQREVMRAAPRRCSPLVEVRRWPLPV